MQVRIQKSPMTFFRFFSSDGNRNTKERLYSIPPKCLELFLTFCCSVFKVRLLALLKQLLKNIISPPNSQALFEILFSAQQPVEATTNRIPQNTLDCQHDFSGRLTIAPNHYTCTLDLNVFRFITPMGY